MSSIRPKGKSRIHWRKGGGEILGGFGVGGKRVALWEGVGAYQIILCTCPAVVNDNDFCLASFADYNDARLFILKLRVAVILSDDFVIADHYVTDWLMSQEDLREGSKERDIVRALEEIRHNLASSK